MHPDGPDTLSFKVLERDHAEKPRRQNPATNPWTDEPMDDLKELLTPWQEKLNLPPAQLSSRQS